MNHNRVEDAAPRYADSSDQASTEEGRGGEREEGKERATRVWEEERENDGLEEGNGIKRIQMEEWETERCTDTDKVCIA